MYTRKEGTHLPSSLITFGTIWGGCNMVKTCKKCLKELPSTKDYFHEKKSGRDGFNAQCKECRKNEEPKEVKLARNREWKKNNQEQVKANRRKYYLEIEQDTHNERCKAYRDKNRDKLRIQANEKYHNNKDKISIQRSIIYFKNAEQCRERQKQWRINNPERSKEIDIKKHHKRRALMKNVAHEYDEKQWSDCLKHFEMECAYCGEPKQLAQEHFVPVSKGGEYTINNIVPSCINCNSRKNDKNFFEWYSKDVSYSKQRERKILTYLNYNDNTQQLSIF
jgi:hypothetical protein